MNIESIDSPEFRHALRKWREVQNGDEEGNFLRIINVVNHHAAQAVAAALEGQLTEPGHGGALYQPQAWPDAWHALRDDVLSGVDGLDNDQVNIVLGMLDNYEPSHQVPDYDSEYAKASSNANLYGTGFMIGGRCVAPDAVRIIKAAAPQQHAQAALSDEQIDEVVAAMGWDLDPVERNDVRQFARAILAASQEAKG